MNSKRKNYLRNNRGTSNEGNCDLITKNPQKFYPLRYFNFNLFATGTIEMRNFNPHNICFGHWTKLSSLQKMFLTFVRYEKLPFQQNPLFIRVPFTSPLPLIIL